MNVVIPLIRLSPVHLFGTQRQAYPRHCGIDGYGVAGVVLARCDQVGHQGVDGVEEGEHGQQDDQILDGLEIEICGDADIVDLRETRAQLQTRLLPDEATTWAILEYLFALVIIGLDVAPFDDL